MTTSTAAHPTAMAGTRPASAGWIVVVLVGIAAATHIWKLPTALDRVRADTGMSLVDAGVLVGLVQLASMLGGLLVAWIGDAVGLRRMVAGGLVLICLGSVAGAWAPDTGLLMAARGLEGVGFLLCTVLGPPLIRRCCTVGQLNRAMAGWGAFQGAATFLGMATTALAVSILPWRTWWVLMALAALIPLPALLRWVPADPPATGSRRRTAAIVGQSILTTLRSPRPWLAGTVFGCYTIQWMAVLGFLPTVFRDVGFTGPAPGLLAAAVGGINALGAVAAGRLLDRGARPRLLIVGSLAAMSATAFVAFGIRWAPGAGGGAALVLCCLAFSLAGGLVPAVITRLTVDVVPPGGTMTGAMGLMQQIFNVGNFAGPPLLAWLATLAGGWHATWWLCCAASVLGAVLLTLLRPGRSPDPPVPALAGTPEARDNESAR